MARFSRSAVVTAAITDADRGWHRNPFNVPGAVADWTARFPDVPIVDDGASDRGRGSTAFDLVRKVNDGGLVRFDWLSIKTGGIESGNKLPSKFTLTTGNPATFDGLVSAYRAGSPLPTVMFASRPKSDKGVALFADLGKFIRHHGIVPVEDYPVGGFGRGKAPPFYFKWSARRPSGVKKAARLRSMGIPVSEGYEVVNGVRLGADWVQYPELVVSLAALGVRRSTWIPAHVNQIPLMLDRTEGFGGTSDDTWQNMQ
jgi:hypothetical protein